MKTLKQDPALPRLWVRKYMVLSRCRPSFCMCMLNICLLVPVDGPWSGQMVRAAPSVGFRLTSVFSDCTEEQMYSSEDSPTPNVSVQISFKLHWHWAFLLGDEKCPTYLKGESYFIHVLPSSTVSHPRLVKTFLLHSSWSTSDLSRHYICLIWKLRARYSIGMSVASMSFHAASKSEPCGASSWWLDGRLTSHMQAQLRLETLGDKNLIEISEAHPGITTRARIKHLVSVVSSFLTHSWLLYRNKVLVHLNIQVTGV